MILRFTRSLNNILVEYQCTLRDVENVNENFIINRPSNIDSYIEAQLFYHLDRKKWTLNEMIFFANNNRICLTIFDNQGLQRAQYGICNECEQGFKINNTCFQINNQFLKIN